MSSNSPSVEHSLMSYRECGCDLDGDIFYYNGKPVYINLRQIWNEGYLAGYDSYDDYSPSCDEEPV